MNITDMNRAIALAKSDSNLDHVVEGDFYGFGLSDFQPVECSLEQVAKLIRYQARYLNGDWDHRAIDAVVMARRKFRLEKEILMDRAIELLEEANKFIGMYPKDPLAVKINKFIKQCKVA